MHPSFVSPAANHPICHCSLCLHTNSRENSRRGDMRCHRLPRTYSMHVQFVTGVLPDAGVVREIVTWRQPSRSQERHYIRVRLGLVFLCDIWRTLTHKQSHPCSRESCRECWCSGVISFRRIRRTPFSLCLQGVIRVYHILWCCC